MLRKRQAERNIRQCTVIVTAAHRQHGAVTEICFDDTVGQGLLEVSDILKAAFVFIGKDQTSVHTSSERQRPGDVGIGAVTVPTPDRACQLQLRLRRRSFARQIDGAAGFTRTCE